MADPNREHFLQQRKRAKSRGIPWRLEYWEWLMIWQDSGHLHERGVHGGEWVMARPGDVGAYEAGNVKIVRCETNNSEAARGWRKKAKGQEQTGIHVEAPE